MVLLPLIFISSSSRAQTQLWKLITFHMSLTGMWIKQFIRQANCMYHMCWSPFGTLTENSCSFLLYFFTWYIGHAWKSSVSVVRVVGPRKLMWVVGHSNFISQAFPKHFPTCCYVVQETVLRILVYTLLLLIVFGWLVVTIIGCHLLSQKQLWGEWALLIRLAFNGRYSCTDVLFSNLKIKYLFFSKRD